MNKTLIEIQNLTIGYESQKVLDNVNLTIDSDDFIGVIFWAYFRVGRVPLNQTSINQK